MASEMEIEKEEKGENEETEEKEESEEKGHGAPPARVHCIATTTPTATRQPAAEENAATVTLLLICNNY